MQIGKAFRRLREEQNLTRTQVAEMMVCTPSALSKIERGRTIPKPQTIETFCTLLCIPLARFYHEAFGPEDFGWPTQPIK